MKVPDSGMPEEHYWNSLFDVEQIVGWLDLPCCHGAVVEIGCGYGTFTLPIARRAPHLTVHALDIEHTMLQRVSQLAHAQSLDNIHTHHRDVVADGTSLPDRSASLVLLFNILHSQHNVALLREAARITHAHGRIAVIHWRTDQSTPRGPAMHLRPQQEHITALATPLHLAIATPASLLPPYHWGMQLKPAST